MTSVPLNAGPRDLLLAHDTLEAGDLLLIGKSDFVSRAIQKFSRSDVSHVLVTIDADHAWDAMDFTGSFSERPSAGGVRHVTLDRYLNGTGLQTVVHLRPLDGLLDRAALLDAIARNAEQPTGFASTGVWMESLLVLAVTRTITELAHRLGVDDELRTLLEHYAQAAADGDATLVCGEFIVRVYAAAGVRIEFTTSMLMHCFANLLDTPITEPGPIDLDAATRRLDAAQQRVDALWATMPAWTPTDLPGSLRDAARSLVRRFHEHTPGERADLVTPSDFFHSPQLRQRARLERDRVTGAWHRADVGNATGLTGLAGPPGRPDVS